MAKVPLTKVSLIPPVGAGLGLPFTVLYADEKNDPTTQSGTNRFNRDGDLWGDSFLRTGQISIQPLPSAAKIVSRQQSGGITPVVGNLTVMKPLYESAYFNTGAPSLNYALGQLEFCQMMQHSSRSLWDATEIRSEFLVPRRTYLEAGRYTSHPRRKFSSARMGNFSLMSNMSAPDVTSLHTPCDQIFGTVGAVDSIGACSNANFNTGMRTAALTHFTRADLPSNGFGLTYGDAHNSIFATSLHSHPLISGATIAGNGIAANGGGVSDFGGSNFYQTWGVMWTLNQHTIPQTLTAGTTLSASDATMTADATNDTDKDFYMKMNSIQNVAVRDIPVYGGTEKVSPVGAPQYGNHVVAESCGLVGFEGTITATGFFSLSAGKMNTGTETLYNTEGNAYGGINIQIHSGLTHRRNRLFSQRDLTANRGYDTIFRYGSDGTAVQPMTDAMKTRAKRFAGSTIDANSSAFYASRTLWDTKGSTGGSGTTEPIGDFSVSNAPAILGDTTNLNIAWDASTTFSSAWMKDKIPTKIRIVPQIVGYENVTVAPGTSKLAQHGTASPIVFRKPIVDYHVIVSVVKPTTKNIVKNSGNGGNNGQADIGDPTVRNNPAPVWPTIDANYDGEPCNIFTAIFRINPTNLEQVYINADYTDASHDLNLNEKICAQSVMPRHNYNNNSMLSKTTQGWGLHQVTPFRPLANHAWSKIPKLCNTVEPGGFYQRGGISHLWDADGYGGELFVSADMTDASDFNSDVWGNGQIWPDGNEAAGNPPGSELMIFKYSTRGDPFYTNGATTLASNPLRSAMVAKTTTDHITGQYVASMDGGFTITDIATKTWRGWSIHDWVFPQKELMRYLGREDKGLLTHHPSIHCSSLSIQEDGRMLMAAIHRDVIVTDDEYPFEDVGFPLNPGLSQMECPPGYFYDASSKTCKSVLNPDYDAGGTIDPNTGTAQTGLGNPRPSAALLSTAGGKDTPPGNNFDRWPTWTTLKATTKARSLILLFSNTPAKDGKLVGGRAKFDITTEKVGTQTVSVENWTFDDTWWNGSRISYWYPESGQRAIPITYGSYPEMRCSHANLPRSLPHLMSDGTHTGGYPQSMPIDRLLNSPAGSNGTTRSTIDVWMTARRNFLLLTRYIPTTIGFADFGLGPNPHQEVGWSGWSFPTGLYDPIDYGDNTDFFRETTGKSSIWANYFANNSANANASRSYIGPRGGFSHFGPLHYGVSGINHPYKTDTIWTQVHGGVGYDLPLHLLIPPAVSVRARNGGNGSLDLELELPFHRTDTIELDGAIGFNSGFDKGPENLPDGTRPSLGNYSLSTNLWNRHTSNTAGAKLGGYDSAYQRVHGPIITGTGLTAFWGDHPTDRFHAAAMPIMPNNIYSHADVEGNNYPPILLARSSEYSKLDQIALSEQLQSSTEVHINHNVRPFWDSGSIISARGVGGMNAKKFNRARFLSEMAGKKVYTSPEACVDFTFTGTTSPDAGLGKGQRILRTPDGTLHNFLLERSGQASSSNMPMWTHYKQPIGQDLFWNSKALKVDGQNYDGKDEVGPLIESLTGSQDKGRVLGAAFASDSAGTIHAVIEYTALKSNSSSTLEMAHRLYYTYAKRQLKSSNPTVVYDWDWSVHTPQLINAETLTGVDGEKAGSPNDLRQPTLVCDATDRLHLAFTQVCKQTLGASRNYSAIWYMNKLQTEHEFPAFVGNDAPPATTDSRIQLVSPIMTSAEESSAATNTPATLNQKVIVCDMPKICLRGDGIPVVFYRGDPTADYTTAARRTTAIYVNRGAEGTSTDAMGRIKFDTSQAVSNLGYVLSGDVNSTPATDVIFYDAIIDEQDRAYTTAIWNQGSSAYHRATQVNTFDTRKDFLKQYTEAKGLGTTRTLYATTVASNTLSYLSDVTMTTNGDGQIHMIFGFTLQGATPKGKTNRKTAIESLISPLQVPATPMSPLDSAGTTGDGIIYDGGYTDSVAHQNWTNGGSFPSKLIDWGYANKHFLEVWMPSFEWSQAGSDDHWVIRSVNMRWLSVPDIGYDSTNGWYPIGSASGISGSENFAHQAPQLRHQRYNGYNASALDLSWLTNELSWNRTPLPQSRLYMPGGGKQYIDPADEGNGGSTEADEIPGYPI